MRGGSNMKVVVTGGLGFIGSHLVDRLISEGYDTYIIDNLTSGQLNNLNPAATFYQADILNESQLRKIFNDVKPEALFHMAAQIDVQTSINNPNLDAMCNIIGSLNLIELCKTYNCKIIYSSSAAIYGSPQYVPVTEEHPINPISNYGISKYTPELYIQTSANLHNLNFNILRYANVYGNRQVNNGEGGVISIFIDKIINGERPIIFGDGTQTRDFIFVEDVVSANIAALKCSANGTFNISTNKKTTINDLIHHLNSILDKKVVPIYEPIRKGDITHSTLDNQLAIKELNWNPKFLIKEGLIKTCDNFLNNMSY